mmetsp:Transcript_4920/g.9395  ORF Transcript_4920/g.9395 Transcript_4920/m.9395 type:complete len:112 (+) Transcript_4920:86-421(+)
MSWKALHLKTFPAPPSQYPPFITGALGTALGMLYPPFPSPCPPPPSPSTPATSTSPTCTGVAVATGGLDTGACCKSGTIASTCDPGAMPGGRATQACDPLGSWTRTCPEGG